MNARTTRLKIMYIARSTIAGLLCTIPLRKCVPWTEDLPEDTIVVNIYYDSARDRFALILASETFPEMEFGAKLEEIKPVYIWVKCIVDQEDQDDYIDKLLTGDLPDGA